MKTKFYQPNRLWLAWPSSTTQTMVTDSGAMPSGGSGKASCKPSPNIRQASQVLCRSANVASSKASTRAVPLPTLQKNGVSQKEEFNKSTIETF